MKNSWNIKAVSVKTLKTKSAGIGFVWVNTSDMQTGNWNRRNTTGMFFPPILRFWDIGTNYVKSPLNL